MRRDDRAREGSLHATPAHTEVFKALGYLTRLQVFFFLLRASREVSLGEIQGALSVHRRSLTTWIFWVVPGWCEAGGSSTTSIAR